MNADAIVVLGAALGPEGDLGPLLAERVLAGVEAWRAGRAPMLLMTGKFEAERMKQRALKLGVPADRVLLESAALTTRENATGCAAILRTHGMSRALVVTQAFHRARAVAAFRRVGIDAEALAFADMRVRWRTRAREVIARAAYRARGWIRSSTRSATASASRPCGKMPRMVTRPQRSDGLRVGRLFGAGAVDGAVEDDAGDGERRGRARPRA